MDKAMVKPNKKKLSKRYNLVIFAILMLGAVVMIFPFVWMLLSSFKSSADIYTYPPKWLPSSFKWSNYKAVFDLIPFGMYYFNSIYTSVMQTFIQIALSIFGAYAIVFLNFPGRKFLVSLIRSTMFVPMVVTLIPMYLIMNGLQDTYAGIILPQVFSAFTIFLITSFFDSIPKDLCDSAKLDGCRHHHLILLGGLGDKVLHSYRKGSVSVLVRYDQRPGVALPVTEEGEHGCC